MKTNAEGKRLSLKKENSVKNLIQSGCSHVLKDFRFRGIFSEHVVRGFKHDVKVTNSISSDTHSAALCCVWLKFKDLKQSNGNVEEHVT